MSVQFLNERFSGEPARVLARFTSPDLTVDVRENSRFRWLQFGNGVVQSAMELAHPHRLALPYTRSMLCPLLFCPPPGRITLLGMGGGSLVRFLRHHLPDAILDAVEWNDEIVAFARRYFAVAAEPGRLAIHVADARCYVAGVHGPADLILVDLFDEGGVPDWLRDAGFYADCRELLGDTGCLSVNLLGHREAEFVAVVTAIRSAFAGATLCTTLVDYENVIVLAFKRPPAELGIDVLRPRALALEKRYGLPFPRILRNIQAVNLTHRGALVV